MSSFPTMPRFRRTHHSHSHFRFKFGSKRNVKTGYYPPGGRTDALPKVPPEQLCISLSDPVLVAVEEKSREIARLKEHEGIAAGRPEKLGVSEVSHPTVSPTATAATTELRCGAKDAHTRRSLRVDSGQVAKDPRGWLLVVPGCLKDPSIEAARSRDTPSLDIVAHETNVTTVVVGPITSSVVISEKRQCVPNLAPLASQVIKEKLYQKGYLRRPTSYLTTAYHSKAHTALTPTQVLGRNGGRTTMEYLQAMLDSSPSPAEERSTYYYSCASMPVPSAPTTESLARPSDSVSSASTTTFDLDEFSYITAYTTPCASPDGDRAEMSQKKPYRYL